MPQTDRLELRELRARQRALMDHPLYGALLDEEALLTFMRSHVFAVWDFQSLLKGLQLRLTGVQVPWLPTADTEARRLINEIVLDEESGPHPDGGHASHFELYLDAMRAAGADVAPIEALLEELAAGATVQGALAAGDWPPGVADFVGTTFPLLEEGGLPGLVAAFTFGREEVIPGMFRAVVAQLAEEAPARWGLFRHYLEVHIHDDEEKHGPMAQALLARVCGDDPQRWAEAQDAAGRALAAREQLWTTVRGALRLRSAA